jgi:hypothetical protein
MKNLSNLAFVSLLALVRCGGSAAISPLGDPPHGPSSSGSSSTASSSTSSTPNVPYPGNPDAACSSRPASGGTIAPSSGRAEATACGPGRSCGIDMDGGGQACSSDADCATPDGSFSYFAHCLRGQCAADGCLADSDCATNQVCACSAQYYGGNACFHPNTCVPADCHVDADCGPGGFCTPSVGYCGTFEAYYCHRPTDPCRDPTVDCSCSVGTLPAACVYSPVSATWVCGQASVCNG